MGMAFIILSTGTITRSRLRTFRISTMLLGLAVVISLTLAGGLRLGYQFGQADAAGPGSVRATTPSLSLAQDIGRPGGQALVDRIGALSGRVIQLEAEAKALAVRIGIVQEAGPRTTPGEKVPPAGTESLLLAAPSGASGGPFVPASAEARSALPSPESDEFDLGRLERDLNQLDLALRLVANAATPRELERMAFPSRLPISGHPITSGFGIRPDPFTRRRARHTGIDIAAPRNTPINAAGGGRVTFAGYRSAYGITVEIDHGNGLATRYAHASRVLVRRGDVVLPEQPIAVIGSTGRSTGTHVHFEVLRNGRPLEPTNFLQPTGT